MYVNIYVHVLQAVSKQNKREIFAARCAVCCGKYLDDEIFDETFFFFILFDLL